MTTTSDVLDVLHAPEPLDDELREAFKVVEQRHRAYESLVRRLRAKNTTAGIPTTPETSYLPAHELTATDLFVEKAHIHLQKRAWFNQALAFVTGAGALGAIIYIAAKIEEAPLLLPNTAYSPSRDGYYFAFDLLKALAYDAVLLGLVYFLASLCRAFLHEATLMENRLHAARLGRLFVYLKFANVSTEDELKEARKTLHTTQLVDIFGWNIETSTAFKDINPKSIAAGLLAQTSALLERVVEAAKAFRTANDGSANRSSD